MASHLVDQPIAGGFGEKLQHFLGRIGLEFARDHLAEEIAEDRLADVDRVKSLTQPPVMQAHADDSQHLRPVALDEKVCCLLVAGLNPGNQIPERSLVAH